MLRKFYLSRNVFIRTLAPRFFLFKLSKEMSFLFKIFIVVWESLMGFQKFHSVQHCAAVFLARMVRQEKQNEQEVKELNWIEKEERKE